ncbi:MAG: M3 family metallopeptidase [Colwellia sp.]
MRSKLTIIAVAIALSAGVTSCGSSEKPQKDTTNTLNEGVQESIQNPLFEPSPLQYQTPMFDKIQTQDYFPAFKAGITAHKKEIQTIVNNQEPATLENTLIALEHSGELLDRTSRVFYSLTSLISDEDFQQVEAEVTPLVTAHSDDIYLNPALFKRVQTVVDAPIKYSAEDQRLVDYYNDLFISAGANLNETQKADIREINTELASLTFKFNQNLLSVAKYDVVLVNDKKQLAGLNESEIESLAVDAKNAGKEGYLITIVNTTRQPLLSQLENRKLREKIWKTSTSRAHKENDPLIKEIVKLRAKKAKILGYATWAEYKIADQMAKTPQAVYKMLDNLTPKSLAKGDEEAQAIRLEMQKEGVKGDVQPWDWEYYTEKVRQDKYNFDVNEVKPFFELDNVVNNGLFYVMTKLYGISFSQRKDLPVYHEDVTVYEVFDEDTSSIGLFYFDPYARPSKAGGAWMGEYVTQSFLKANKPVVYNVLNIPKPAPGQATLLTNDEVGTLFHEFGHALHGLFSQVKYPSLAGSNTASDFVEFPSQVHEDWAFEPSVLKHYAKHYKTGEVIPNALLDKMLASKKFNQGFDTTEYLAAVLLDLKWHDITPEAVVEDVEAFEKKSLIAAGVDNKLIPPRYKSAYYSHIFGGGYSAGYYAYLWSEVFGADAFYYMLDNGGLTRENGDKFRKEVLSQGSSRDLMLHYTEFRGQEPTIDAMLKRKGF